MTRTKKECIESVEFGFGEVDKIVEKENILELHFEFNGGSDVIMVDVENQLIIVETGEKFSIESTGYFTSLSYEERKFTSRLGRTIDTETLVGVHWNTHKKVWSIVKMNSRHSIGLVLGYASQVTLVDVTTHIDKSKRKKALEVGTKDRHAFMVGYLDNFDFESLEKNIYYSPKKVDSFVDAQTFFQGEINYIEHVERVSMDFNFEKNHPVVVYNA